MGSPLIKCVAQVTFPNSNKSYDYFSQVSLKRGDKAVVRVRRSLIEVKVVNVVTDVDKIVKSKATKWIEAVKIPRTALPDSNILNSIYGWGGQDRN